MAETPYGAVPTDDGVHFALFSEHATAVELSIFDRPESAVARRRIPLRRGAGGVWRKAVADAGPGTLYGYRVDGPWEPQRGHRFNPAKLLVDPWARALTGEPRHHASLYAFEPGSDPDRTYNGRDSAAFMPKSVVVDPAFDWQDDVPPQRPWRETVIYEGHVRGMTMRHPGVPEGLRGTYLGLASEPVVEHLLALGVTAVELLPVQQIAREPHLAPKGLKNYWGYSTLGYFAPHAAYATGVLGEQVTEFKTMVRELHRAGIEVILDVVLNHTAEGGCGGPTLAFRGLDNSVFYRLVPRNPRYYVDWTGCGNTLDLGRRTVRDFAVSCLRYWVEEMHVDGFRFDLAPVLGREDGPFDPAATFFRALSEDPVLSRVKLLAEPWDLGPQGYQLGHFPAPWAEWNDRTRDAVRRFWRGSGGAGELARRLAGSRDLFPSRGPLASVSFVACHDGFTLTDLTRYEHKHNEANLEDNRDGHGHNLSRGWGAEGPSDDPGVVAARERARRNLLATVLLSPGVPMIGHGDELGRTQGGNNNAYCQDNETAWVDWHLSPEDERFLAFAKRLVALRRDHPELSPEDPAAPRRFYRGDGVELDAGGHWPEDLQAFALLVPSAEGDLLLLLNGGEHTETLSPGVGDGWRTLLDTTSGDVSDEPCAAPFVLPGLSLRLLIRTQ